MATGGARPGAGAKKGQHRIAPGELRHALEAALGIPYEQMLAESQVKLFNDFKQDKHVKEYINFTQNMCNRILEDQKQALEVTNLSAMSKEELEAYRQSLIQKSAT